MTEPPEPATRLDHIRGHDDAPVAIIEYGDYECVFSGFAYYTLRRIAEDLQHEAKLVFRNFPLTQIRSNAFPAALAAEAAGAQHQFWEMHDILFEHQDALEPEHLLTYAQVLGMDIERFISDMTSDNTAARIRHDFVGGLRSGVNITPTLFMNGRPYDWPYDYQTLRPAVEQEAKLLSRRLSLKGSRPAPASRGR